MSAESDNKLQAKLATDAQDRLEQLVRTGRSAGAAALAPMRSGVRRALKESKTPEELRHHLIELMRLQGPDALAKQLGRARDMAQMGGQIAVANETET